VRKPYIIYKRHWRGRGGWYVGFWDGRRYATRKSAAALMAERIVQRAYVDACHAAGISEAERRRRRLSFAVCCEV
jgi:hypothetical protein